MPPPEPGRILAVLALGDDMRVAVHAAVLVAAVAAAAIEVWAVEAGWPWYFAALDLLAGCSLLAAAGWAGHLAGRCRALLGLSGVLWFAATPQIVGGLVGHIAALLGAAWLAPLATAALGSPDAVPAGLPQRLALVPAWARLLPVLSGVGWLTAAAGGSLAAAAVLGLRHAPVRAPRVLAGLLGALMGVSGLLQASAGRGSLLGPFVAVSVAGCGVALLMARSAPAATGAGLAGLVVELGRATDAWSLERQLARALGDRQLRLLYQLAPGLPFVDTSGQNAGPAAEGREVTIMGQSGPVVAALEHDHATLTDPLLRQAVLAVGRLAVLRLVRASEAAQQSVELAQSRRRLVEAETAAREQFAHDVAEGPGRTLASCLAVLDQAHASASASLRADLAAVRATARAAQEEVMRITAGTAARMLAGIGLGPALSELAGSVGAEADLRIDCDIDRDVALAAWFAASEALANALKHAGPARIWLTATTQAGRLRLEVSDDGVGGADPGGRGLHGLAERMIAQGGHLEVLGGQRGGTRVVAELPVCVTS